MKENVSNLTNPMLHHYLMMLPIVNGKVCIQLHLIDKGHITHNLTAKCTSILLSLTTKKSSKLKKAKIPRKKIESEFSGLSAHCVLYTYKFSLNSMQ